MFVEKRFLFWTTNIIVDNRHCDVKVNIFKFLSNCLLETLFPHPFIILIAFFLHAKHCGTLQRVPQNMNNWFKVNQLTLNYNKTNFLQFNMKNSWDCELKLNYQGNCIKSPSNTKFLVLTIDDSLSQKAHIDQMMSKLNTACFVIRTLQAIMSLETLIMVYFAYIHSVISYGIIFLGGNKPYSDKILKIQKRMIRIITSSRSRDSCRKLFKNLEKLPLYSQYIYSISIYVVKNKRLFYTNNQIHSIHTRFKTNLHPPTANLTKFQKGVYYSAIKIFNKDLANDILPFRNALKRFLLIKSFYNGKEYFNYH